MKFYTTAQVAAMLGVTPGRVRQVRQELCLGQRFGATWLYSPHDVAGMRARRTKSGRPWKQKTGQGPVGRE